MDLLIKYQVFCEMFFDPTQLRLVMAIGRNKNCYLLAIPLDWREWALFSLLSTMSLSLLSVHTESKNALLHSLHSEKHLTCIASTLLQIQWHLFMVFLVDAEWLICHISVPYVLTGIWQPNMELLTMYPVFNKNRRKRNKRTQDMSFFIINISFSGHNLNKFCLWILTEGPMIVLYVKQWNVFVSKDQYFRSVCHKILYLCHRNCVMLFH